MLLIAGGAGGSVTVGSTSGGKVYAFNNISTTPRVVAPANPNRTGINFYNPGTVNIFVAPANVQAINTIANLTNTPLVPSGAALGGCYLVYANGGQISLVGECQGVWQAFAIAGTTNPFTVSDSNV